MGPLRSRGGRLPAAARAVARVPRRPRGDPRAPAPVALHGGALRPRRRPALRPGPGRRGLRRDRGDPHVRRGRPRPRQPRGGPDAHGRRAGVGPRARDAGRARPHDPALRLGRLQGLARARHRPRRRTGRLRPRPRPRPHGDGRLADGGADPDRPRPRHPRLRGHGGPRPVLLLPRRAAGDGGDRRGLPPHLLAHPARHPAPHRVRLRARRERRVAPPPPLLQVAPRLDAGRPRGDRHRRLRALHHLHRRLRDHGDRDRRPRAAHAREGRVPGGLLARPRHRRREPGAPLPAFPAGDPLQRGGRNARPERAGGPPVPGRAPARDPHDRHGGGVRRAHAARRWGSPGSRSPAPRSRRPPGRRSGR